jgi:hypothetical protein
MVNIDKIACPILNEEGSRTRQEVFVKFDDVTGTPRSVMCSEYDAEGKNCKIKDGQECIYSSWADL